MFLFENSDFERGVAEAEIATAGGATRASAYNHNIVDVSAHLF